MSSKLVTNTYVVAAYPARIPPNFLLFHGYCIAPNSTGARSNCAPFSHIHHKTGNPTGINEKWLQARSTHTPTSRPHSSPPLMLVSYPRKELKIKCPNRSSLLDQLDPSSLPPPQPSFSLHRTLITHHTPNTKIYRQLGSAR